MPFGLGPLAQYIQTALYSILDILESFLCRLALGDTTRNGGAFHHKPAIFPFAYKDFEAH